LQHERGGTVDRGGSGGQVEADPALAVDVRHLGDVQVERVVSEDLCVPQRPRHPGERRADPLHPLQPGVRRQGVVPLESGVGH
jgi:hypothetical protein